MSVEKEVEPEILTPFVFSSVWIRSLMSLRRNRSRSKASCPDALVDAVLRRLLSFFSEVKGEEEVLKSLVIS